MKFMPKGMFLNGPALGLELIYSLVVVALSFGIYYKTREFYELSNHKGIKYFRNAFLFFGIAYLSRFLLRFIIVASDAHHILRGVHQLGFFIFLYAGLMAGFLLIYSIIWKRFKNPEGNVYFMSFIAALIAAADVLIKRGQDFLFVITILFIVAAILAYFSNKKKTAFTKLYVTYSLFFLSWIANAAAHFFIRVSFLTGILLYCVSAALFLAIFIKVSRSMGGK